jgi:glycerate kinase
MIVAVDVQNCLLGARGATRVYGPQKGIRPEDFDLAERCLAQLASVMSKQFSQDFAASPGSGAAGGLGFGLLAFLGAKPEPGFELFAQNANLEHRLSGVELVITGEGAIDESTLMGKGVGQIASLCAEQKISCVGLAGSVSAECRGNNFFSHLGALVDLTDASQAKAQPALWLERLAEKMAAQLAVVNR